LSKCHNSDKEKNSSAPNEKRCLSGSQAKTAFALRLNCSRLVEDAGIESVGFLTLTVGDYWCVTHGKQLPAPKNKRAVCPCCCRRMEFRQIFDAAEASRRIDSLRRRVLSNLFSCAVIVSERHESTAIHFHLLGALLSRLDIRTGFNFGQVRRKNYSSVCSGLLAIWANLRATLPLYGFGRAELTPVRKTGGAVASYVSKYIEKNVMHRNAQDKGKKLVRYHGFRKTQLKPNEFEWDTTSARGWRARAAAALALVGVPLRDLPVSPALHVSAFVDASAGQIRAKALDGSMACNVIGSRWAYLLTMLLEKLGLNKGDTLTLDYITGDILSCELQRMAGRSWCRAQTHPLREVVLGEEYTRREWREYLGKFN
jgi:hypothetical protein